MRSREYVVKGLRVVALGCVISAFLAAPAIAQQKAEASNMNLVGYTSLQGRGSYMSVIQKQGERWIAYIGHEDGIGLNPLTGQQEPNGTSIVDVTDPKHPKYLAHVPGELIKRPGEKDVINGAQFARVCSGNDLPHADKNKFYLLRDFGRTAWELWDVTDPVNPSRLNVVVSGLKDAHAHWWECDSGIAYLDGGPLDWRIAGNRSNPVDHALIYDLSNPAKPVFIRSFGLPGQEPGSAVPQPPVGLHGLISAGPKGNRVYFANGNTGNGILEIVDREKLLNGPKVPTDENLRYPVVATLNLPPDIGVQTAFPLYQIRLPEFAKQKDGFVKDFLAVIGQNRGSATECRDSRQMVRIFDVTTESKPVGVSTWTVPEASGNFCSRGGVFGTHASNENFTPIYYERVLFIAHFNAGVRAVDIRDPYHPKEIGYYIPAVMDKTENGCVAEGAERHCKITIQTNDVEVDDRGYIYMVDRNSAGLHILELTGPARQLADFSKADGVAAKR
jgi:hypothetical protein